MLVLSFPYLRCVNPNKVYTDEDRAKHTKQGDSFGPISGSMRTVGTRSAEGAGRDVLQRGEPLRYG